MIIFLLFIPEKEEENNKEGLGGGETGMWRKIILGHEDKKTRDLAARTGGDWNWNRNKC